MVSYLANFSLPLESEGKQAAIDLKVHHTLVHGILFTIRLIRSNTEYPWTERASVNWIQKDSSRTKRLRTLCYWFGSVWSSGSMIQAHCCNFIQSPQSTPNPFFHTIVVVKMAPIGTRTRNCFSRVRRSAGLSISGRDTYYILCSVFNALTLYRTQCRSITLLIRVHYTNYSTHKPAAVNCTYEYAEPHYEYKEANAHRYSATGTAAVHTEPNCQRVVSAKYTEL